MFSIVHKKTRKPLRVTTRMSYGSQSFHFSENDGLPFIVNTLKEARTAISDNVARGCSYIERPVHLDPIRFLGQEGMEAYKVVEVNIIEKKARSMI